MVAPAFKNSLSKVCVRESGISKCQSKVQKVTEFEVRYLGLKFKPGSVPRPGKRLNQGRAYMIELLPEEAGKRYSCYDLVAYHFPKTQNRALFRSCCDAFNKTAKRLLSRDGTDALPESTRQQQAKSKHPSLTKAEWQQAIPNDLYNELVKLDERLAKLLSSSGEGARFYCDFYSLELIERRELKPGNSKNAPQSLREPGSRSSETPALKAFATYSAEQQAEPQTITALSSGQNITRSDRTLDSPGIKPSKSQKSIEFPLKKVGSFVLFLVILTSIFLAIRWRKEGRLVEPEYLNKNGTPTKTERFDPPSPTQLKDLWKVDAMEKAP